MNRNPFLLLLGLSVTIVVGGCGYPYYYEGVVTIETESTFAALAVKEVHAIPVDHSVKVRLSWDTWPVNLDLELLTPSHHLVTAAGFSIDGCYHLGDDIGAIGPGSEKILCNFPLFGDYEIQIVNHSGQWISSLVVIQFTQKGPIDEVIDEFVENVHVEPWGLSIIPVHFR